MGHADPNNRRDSLIFLYACCGGRTPKYRKPKLTCHNGTGCEENLVNGHHRRCIVELRGLVQEPRAEGTS